MTSRELVYKTLEFKSPSRVPRHLWYLPWAEYNHKIELEKIIKDFPDDIVNCTDYCKEKDISAGDPYGVGNFNDAWGCKFTGRQKGVFGEVKEPIVTDEEWLDTSRVHFPKEWLTFDIDKVNDFCNNTDKFVLPSHLVRPFEQLQFIRGTENLFIDLMLMPDGLKLFMDKLHNFNCELMEKWAKTNVDALFFMDDWGSQTSLLINPTLWEELFKPMYKDYIDIAHNAGKKAFMHSDGYIVDIYPHLIDLGLDAINSQVFCMNSKVLSDFKGKITFWGEIDRQNLLPKGTPQEIKEAVKSLKENLWSNGGCIAQCEFGPGANPSNVYNVFKTWK
jgi:uroporphyrinogen decarboxylase